MDNAADKAQAVLAQQSGSSERTEADPVRCSDGEVLEIWKRMASIYGHKWTGTYGEKIDSIWRRALQSMPVDRLKLALARCGKRSDPWPPSLPEFIKLARVWPEEVGAPESDQAFNEACQGSHPVSGRVHTWSHRSVYWAAVWTGMEPLRERPLKARKAFDKAYQSALEQYGELPEAPAAQLEHRLPDPGPEADEAAKSALAEMRAALCGSSD